MTNQSEQKKKRNKTITKIVMTLSMGLLLLYITQGLGIEMQTILDIETRLAPDRSQVPILAEYKVIETSGFEKLWVISNAFVTRNRYGNGLIATNDSLYFIGSITEQRFQLLSRLDLLTGQQEWPTSKESQLPIVTTFNSSYIFTGTGSRGQITAYNLESGAIAWKRSLPLRARAIDYMSAIEGDLYVNGSGSVEFYILDIENGRIRERGHPRGVIPIFFSKGDVVYHGRFRKFLVASNKITNDILWEIEFEEEIFQAPLFIEDTVLIRTDKSGFLGEIFAVGLVNGKTLWNSPKNVTSNVAAANGTAYYLTEDSYLMAVDMKTGQKIEEVVFSPSLTTLEPIDRVNNDFYVVADDEIVVVYFGSGSQLFAFRFLLRGL